MVTKRNSPPAPPPVEPDREQRLLELQQTLAQTQRTLAEALLALSSGQALGVQPLARTASDGTRFNHDGTLDISNDGKLFFLDGGTPYYLDELADTKRIQLEFGLQTTPNALREAPDVALFNALGKFLLERSERAVKIKCTCECQDN